MSQDKVSVNKTIDIFEDVDLGNHKDAPSTFAPVEEPTYNIQLNKGQDSPSTLAPAEEPTHNIQLNKGQDNPWKDTQFKFDGAWLPDVDGTLIGPSNYQTLENLRYKDSGLEGVNGYTKINTTAITTYTKLREGHQLRTNKTQDSYVLVHAVDSGDQGRVLLNRTAPGSQGDFQTAAQVAADTVPPLDTGGNEYFQDASSGLLGRFSDAPQGNIVYCNGEESMIFGGDEQRIAACFQVDDTALANPIDVTTKISNTLTTSDNVFTIDKAGKEFALLMTTRPIQGIKIYVSSANVTDPAAVTVKTWTGAAFAADLVSEDYTDEVGDGSGTISLSQTGKLVFSSHTDGTAKLMHFEELYLYAYLVELSAGSADIYHITADFAMQSVKDVWDGVYRQPIQFQVLDSTIYYDYTLQVNESSDVNAPIGAELEGNGTNATDKVYVMFEDQTAAMRWTFLANKINDAAVTMTMKYWDGSSYSALSITDGTIGEATKTCSQSGLISWTPPTDEVPRSQFGSFGYSYEIDFSAALAATGAGTSTLVDVCTGVPHQYTVGAFDFSALYGTRLMLGGFGKGDEGNRIDYSVANAPDAFNGFDSSDGSKQSLYFGGVEDCVAATQIYNRFGSSIYTMFLVLKRNEVYVMTGTVPEDFTIYSVANTIGCVAPSSLATAEVGLDLGNGLTRSVAIWLSHSGPVMFDGAILAPIKGIQSYFDPNDDNYIKFSLIKHAKGWVDPNYKEYNLVIPSSTSATKNNIWLVYDMVRRKWFKKTTTDSALPQTGFEVGEPDTGQRYVYGGIDVGTMLLLEDGYTWGDSSDSSITQRVKTGDVFPSENIWDETLLRKFKIYMKRLTDSSLTTTLAVKYYQNTEPNTDSDIIWEDANSANGVFVNFEDTSDTVWESSVIGILNIQTGTSRAVRLIQNLNKKGWSHAFQFELTTSDVNKGFQPLIWGVQYRLERKDNTETS